MTFDHYGLIYTIWPEEKWMTEMEIRSLAVNALWIEQGHKVYVEDILMDQALLVVNYYGYAITLKLPPAPQ